MTAIEPALAVIRHPDLDNSADWLWCGIMDGKHRFWLGDRMMEAWKADDFVSAGLNEDQSWSA